MSFPQVFATSSLSGGILLVLHQQLHPFLFPNGHLGLQNVSSKYFPLQQLLGD